MNTAPWKPLRVFLLDDHALVRRGIRDLLSAARDISVVGEADTARSAPAMILASEADVMVLDLHLQDGSGIHVCREVRSANTSVKGLLLTAAGDAEAAMAAVLAGASGYSVKLSRTADIVGQVRAVGAGKTLVDASAAERLVSRLDEVRPALSGYERHLAGLIAEGMTNREIADELGRDESRVSDDADRLIAAITGLGRGPGAAPEPPRGRHVRRSD